ncbi:MAG: hypothetical protein PWQ06_1534 [Anaerophaga sp.]|jgi:hypothetical protein|nr:hypothetical protein [Anaerophaga sp.]
MVYNIPVNEELKEAACYYHHPYYQYNCAQSIVYHYNGSGDKVTCMKAMGSGRTPKGYCGALHHKTCKIGKNVPEW